MTRTSLEVLYFIIFYQGFTFCCPLPEIFYVHIMASSFVFLCDSSVCKCVIPCFYVFLPFFLWPFNFCFCSIIIVFVCLLILPILIYYINYIIILIILLFIIFPVLLNDTEMGRSLLERRHVVNGRIWDRRTYC